jgi:hypothetical protein
MRLRIVAALTLALAGTLASAKGDATSVVKLKNGTVQKGVLLERVPGDHVTLKLSTGENKRFDWNDVDSIEEPPEGASSASEAPAASASEPPPKASESTAPAPSVSAAPSSTSGLRVRMTGSPNAALERHEGTAWTFACLAPCEKPLESGEYRVGGEGVNPSRTFMLREPSQLDVKTGSKGRAFGGQLLLGAGAGLLLIGVFMTSQDSDLGIPLMAVGGGAAIGGVTLWLTNRTSITLTPTATGLRLNGTTSLF